LHFSTDVLQFWQVCLSSFRKPERELFRSVYKSSRGRHSHSFFNLVKGQAEATMAELEFLEENFEENYEDISYNFLVQHQPL
jgi:hypothetical protein